jgi:hypothetical protein
MLADTQKIVIESQREEILKQSLIQTIEAAEMGWYKYAESLWRKLSIFLLLFGSFLFLIYWHNLRIHRLLKKLNVPPNNSLQPTAKSCVG